MFIKKLVRFLDANALLPINDSIIEYLKYFKREEQMKRNHQIAQHLPAIMKKI